jgi:hypothetical protein
MLDVMKALKKMFSFSLMILALASSAIAQGEPEMADKFRADGKIYVVVVVIAIVFAGLAFWLFRLDSRIRKMEKENND